MPDPAPQREVEVSRRKPHIGLFDPQLRMRVAISLGYAGQARSYTPTVQPQQPKGRLQQQLIECARNRIAQIAVECGIFYRGKRVAQVVFALLRVLRAGAPCHKQEEKQRDVPKVFHGVRSLMGVVANLVSFVSA